MSWSVHWEPNALSTLAAIWTNSGARQAVTTAERTIDRLLATDPLANGSPVSEGLYSIEVHPLRALFELDTALRKVSVVSVGELPYKANSGSRWLLAVKVIVAGWKMIYLDNAATSFPKPEVVYQTLDRFARENLANPGRAGHKMALAAERELDDARHLLNQFFHGEATERFVFTLNGTDALNMAFKGVLQNGEHVITTDLEHNSVSRPLRKMELDNRITLTRIHADSGGTIDPDAIRKAISPRTRLIALTHASNVLGTIQPIAEVGRIARDKDLLFLVDAAQTAGVIPIDVQAMMIDLLAFPGHKSLLGPTGTGALYVGPRANVSAWREGGTGGDSANETQPREFPYFLEGGTPNVLGVAGLAAGVGYVHQQGLERIHAHEVALTEQLWRRLDELGSCEIFGHRDSARRVGTLSFRCDALPATELGGILDQAFDIAVRPGLHCAPYIHRALGTFPEGTVRVSVGPFNTEADIDHLARALAEILA